MKRILNWGGIELLVIATFIVIFSIFFASVQIQSENCFAAKKKLFGKYRGVKVFYTVKKTSKPYRLDTFYGYASSKKTLKRWRQKRIMYFVSLLPMPDYYSIPYSALQIPSDTELYEGSYFSYAVIVLEKTTRKFYCKGKHVYTDEKGVINGWCDFHPVGKNVKKSVYSWRLFRNKKVKTMNYSKKKLILERCVINSKHRGGYTSWNLHNSIHKQFDEVTGSKFVYTVKNKKYYHKKKCKTLRKVKKKKIIKRPRVWCLNRKYKRCKKCKA